MTKPKIEPVVALYKQLSKLTKDPKNKLREIERSWSSPMANDTNTRIRFAMWETLRHAAKLVRGTGAGKLILAELNRDQRKFDRYGHGDCPVEVEVRKMLASARKG